MYVYNITFGYKSSLFTQDSNLQVDPNDPNGPDIETKIDEIRQNIRRAETSKAKAEARIECLRAGGVSVDEIVQEAEALSVQDLPRSSSSLSVRTDASGMAVSTNTPPTYCIYQEFLLCKKLLYLRILMEYRLVLKLIQSFSIARIYHTLLIMLLDCSALTN